MPPPPPGRPCGRDMPPPPPRGAAGRDMPAGPAAAARPPPVRRLRRHAAAAAAAPALGHRGLAEGAKNQHCCENEADLLEHPRSPRRRRT